MGLCIQEVQRNNCGIRTRQVYPWYVRNARAIYAAKVMPDFNIFFIGLSHLYLLRCLRNHFCYSV